MRAELWTLIFDADDIIEIRAIRGNDEKPHSWWGTAFDLGIHWPEIEKHNTDGWNIYFGINPRAKTGVKSAAGITTFRTVVVDLDKCSCDDMASQLLASRLPDPTVTVSSGRGYHLYWRLTAPVSAVEWKAAQKAVISRFPSADKLIHDAPRVMRVPGTTNTRSGSVCTVEDFLNLRARIEVFQPTQNDPKPVAPARAPETRTGKHDTSALARAHLYYAKKEGVDEGIRNAEAYKVAAMVACEYDLDQASVLQVVDRWNQRCRPPLDLVELEKIVQSAMGADRGVRGSKNRELPSRSPNAQDSRGSDSRGNQVDNQAIGNSPIAPVDQGATQRRKSDNPPNMATVEELGRVVSLIIGTTQVWHEELCMSMPIDALLAMHPVEGKVWKGARDKRQIRQDQIVFEPVAELVREGDVNLWRGFTTKRDPRPCPMLLQHVGNMCQNDPMVTAWLLSWMALPLQRPGVKLDAAVIMKGPPGTGKSMLWSCYRAIYGEYGRKITQSTLEDGYTGWMSRSLFVHAEEVCSTRGQRAKLKNLLKDWVTGDSAEIREKYQVQRNENSHMNYVFCSNESVPLPIDPNDRRFAVIESPIVSDRDYYMALGLEIEDNGPARLYNYLLDYDVGEFWEHSPPPMTAAKIDLQDLCKPSHEEFFEAWRDGDIPQLPFVSCKLGDLYHAYMCWSKLDGGTQASNRMVFAKYLATKLERRHNNTVRYYFVDSAECELRFEEALRGYIRFADTRRVK